MSTQSPAIDGYCPVAYFAANKPLKGKPEFSSAHDGKTYWFLSEGAKAAFDEDPGKYVPAFGGQCAFGTSIGETFAVDPTRFKIVDGRLLLFLHNDEVDALGLWNDKDEAQLLARADANFAAKTAGGSR